MQPTDRSSPVDIAIVGAGAAGLATGIFAARRDPSPRIVALDGAAKLGAKILISGGGRCNVTHRVVSADDYCGGNVHLVRRILAALPVEATIRFFREIGVSLHEEENGKLFPDTNRARTVLDALLGEARRLGIEIRCGRRVTAIERCDEGFHLSIGGESLTVRKVVLATGGLSYPKTGSDGTGYQFASSLGHTLTPTTPALAPLILDGDFHTALSGIAHEVELTIRPADGKAVRIRGPMLWTHFGISGPAALDASRHWHRARIEQRGVTVSASFLPGESFETAEAGLVAKAGAQPRALLHTVLSGMLPARVAAAVLKHLRIGERVQMAHLTRDDRRRLVRGLLEWPLPILESRGYAHAEVTAGGVPLTEVNAATMESRVCPGLYLVGEILDVEGRLGGFNFQWAWCTGFVAASGLTRPG